MDGLEGAALKPPDICDAMDAPCPAEPPCPPRCAIPACSQQASSIAVDVRMTVAVDQRAIARSYACFLLFAAAARFDFLHPMGNGGRALLAGQAHRGCAVVAQEGCFALFSLWGWFAALLSPMNLMF